MNKPFSYLFIFILICLFPISLIAEEVTISGEIKNGSASTPKAIRVIYTNPFSEEKKSVELDGNNSFCVKGDMPFTRNMTVNYRNNFINLLVSPGDSVFLEIDDSIYDGGNFDWLTIRGDNAVVNTQLNKLANYIYTSVPIYDYDITLSPDDFNKSIQEDYNRYLSELEKYSQENHIEEVVQEWAKIDIKYMIANYIVDYAREEGEDTEEGLEKRKAVFFSDFFDIYNEKNACTMFFEYHLDWSVGILIGQQGYERNKDGLKILDLIFSMPESYSRDYLVYKTLNYMIVDNPYSLDSIEGVNTYFTNPVYYDYLQQRISHLKNPQYDTVFLSEVEYLTPSGETELLPRDDIFSYLSSKHQGKVIYVDVYATWCVPCRKEFPVAKELHKELEGEDIVFVNLCLSSNKDNWLKLVEEIPLNGENYFFGKNDTQLFMGSYDFIGFPMYALVDKEGKIVTTHAPRPSDSVRLKEQLEKLLN